MPDGTAVHGAVVVLTVVARQASGGSMFVGRLAGLAVAATKSDWVRPLVLLLF